MRVHFGPFVLDRDTRQLLNNGEVRPLEPKALQLLDLLISRRPAAVSKQEIHDQIWPDAFVSESTLSSLVAQLRRALEDEAVTKPFVRTVHGYGYAFDAPEPVRPESPARVAAHVEWERRALPLIEGENLLGRGEEVGLRIDVPGVSRCHARIAGHAGRWTLEDLGSKNGTFLREQRLQAPASLEDGDEFRLGRSVLLVFRARPARGTTNTEA